MALFGNSVVGDTSNFLAIVCRVIYNSLTIASCFLFFSVEHPGMYANIYSVSFFSAFFFKYFSYVVSME